MKFVLDRCFQRTRVLYIDGEKIIAARGCRLFVSEKNKEIPLPASFLERFFSLFLFTRLGLRFGVHAVQPLGDGRILAVLKKRFVLIDKDGSTSVVDRVHRGNKPLPKGICMLPDGSVLYGEYLLNNDRKSPVAVYRTQNPVSGFKKIFEFPSGEVRHIHFLQWDSFEGCLWMGTGDEDSECHFFKSIDLGENWIKVGGGSQEWRALQIIFTPEFLYWGTDAASTSNVIVRLDRKTKEITCLQQIQGTCHGAGFLHNGTLVMSTGVEGASNEIDASAHLWASRDGTCWHEVYTRPKNMWPHIIQFGVMRIPPGIETTDVLHFNGLALRGASETWFSGILEDEV